MRKLLLVALVVLFSVVLFSCNNEKAYSNEVVGNEKGVGYVSIKLPPLADSSRTLSSSEAISAVGDYVLYMMSDQNTCQKIWYSEQENGFDRVAMPVGTYQLILTAMATGGEYQGQYNSIVVGIAYTEGVQIEEFKMTKVSMTLAVPSLTVVMPDDIYINSSLITQMKFELKGLPERSNNYIHYTPWIYQLDENGYAVKTNSTFQWTSGVYGEFVDVPYPAPQEAGDYILGIELSIGIGYASGSDNALLGKMAFIPKSQSLVQNNSWSQRLEVGNQLYSVGFSATVPPTGVDLNVGWEGDKYTLAFSADENGSVDCSSINDVERDTVIVVDANTLTIGETVVTATPNSGFVFDSWSNLPDGNKIIEDTNITAIFVAST